MIKTKVVHPLYPIMPQHCPDREQRSYTMLNQEALSFQLAYRILDGSTKEEYFFVKAESELPLNCYVTGCVPVLHADYSTIQPVAPIGMYPDILIPKRLDLPLQPMNSWNAIYYYEPGEQLLLCAYNDSWQGLWFAVNEEGDEVTPGSYTIRITLWNQAGKQVGEESVTVTVMEQSLPKQKTVYTNWFHYDCLADFYRVELFSDEYIRIMRDYIRKAVRNGMNMILLPAFTPPLDTPVGGERMTVQLVKVKVSEAGYEFDFSELRRFLRICQEEGITYFEHSHFFSQWRAEHAPKIVAEQDGVTRQIFGWGTDATGEEYIGFLRRYLTCLREILREEGLEKRILFHLSDEPDMRTYQSYQAVYEKLADLLEGYLVGDAMLEPQVMEQVPIRLPIAQTVSVKDFLHHRKEVWCYYTGGMVEKGMSNRLIQLPRERNRILGIQMYYHGVQGFLHWGYNFYYGRLSKGLFDPKRNPCGGFPNAGTSYMVYPAEDGTAYQSVRQKIFLDGLTDIRALELLEALTDRSVCEQLIREYFGEIDFYTSPDGPEALIAFREAVNDGIIQASVK